MKASIFILTLFSYFITIAQENLHFEEKTHDFGVIKEEDGAAEFTFKFLNGTSDSLRVLSVKASCGCTTPGWSREFIAPGDSGYVTARYNTRNRPGKFRKSLRVQTSDGRTNFLYITGSVIPRPKTIEEELPTLIGNLRFKYKSLNVGRITTEKPVEKSFEFYNAGDSTITIDLETSTSPEFVSLGVSKTSIEPKEKALLVITYDPVLKDDLGFVTDPLLLATSDSEEPEKSFSINATITEYFPPMSEEELAKAPRLFLETSQLDFGQVSGNTIKEDQVKFINNGQQKLEIRKVTSNCDCITITYDDDKIKPGKSGTIKVSFDSKGRRGRQYKTLTVFSNDPVAPTQVISLKADVNQ